MTGYGVVYDNNNTNPETRFSVIYFTGNALQRAAQILRQDAGRADRRHRHRLCHEHHGASGPRVAPFEARELLQRFVTENPSAQYIADIAAVWRDKQNAPDQIAQVITAIVNHPEFIPSYHSMPKQPAELVIDSLRADAGHDAGDREHHAGEFACCGS